MTDGDLVARLVELDRDGANGLPEMRDILKREGGISRLIGIAARAIPKCGEKAARMLPLGEYKPSDHKQELARKQWQKVGRHDLDVATEIDKFRAHHTKSRSTSASWDASWQTWYCNAPNMTPPPRGMNGKAALRVVEPGAFKPTDAAGWAERVAVWLGQREEPRGFWVPAWGPVPGAEGCMVPASLVPQRAVTGGSPL